MADLHEELQDIPVEQGSILTKSLNSSKKPEEKVTNEDLQATMMAVLRSIEKSSQNMEKKLSKYGEELSQEKI